MTLDAWAARSGSEVEIPHVTALAQTSPHSIVGAPVAPRVGGGTAPGRQPRADGWVPRAADLARGSRVTGVRLPNGQVGRRRVEPAGVIRWLSVAWVFVWGIGGT